MRWPEMPSPTAAEITPSSGGTFQPAACQAVSVYGKVVHKLTPNADSQAERTFGWMS